MTCAECVELLSGATVGSTAITGDGLDADTFRALTTHLDSCVACRRVERLIVAGHVALAHSLGHELAGPPTALVAERAWRRVRRTPHRRMVAAAALALGIALAWAAWTFVIPEASRLLAPPPSVVVRTFTLACLSPDEAASLLRPYLPVPENPRWQAERFDVTPAPANLRAVTVRAPQALIDRIPALLQDFERARGPRCRQ